MTIAGWIVMLLACGGTTLGFIWCLVRVLRARDQIHGPVDTRPADPCEP